MHEAAAPTLAEWANFYVIVGSSAGALTGLQFVVLTLIAQVGRRGSPATLTAFGSPNVVHFCAALLVSAIMAAPWHTLRQESIPLALLGVAGVFYSVEVLRRTRSQRDYQPVFEDWLWHTMLPFLAYAALAVGGVVLGWKSSGTLFVIGGATLLLVFIGIHNAWDTVTYVTFMASDTATPDGDARPAPSPPSESPRATAALAPGEQVKRDLP
jgi:hypothetical protein